MTLILMDRYFECSGCGMQFDTILELDLHQLNNCIDKWDKIRQARVLRR